MSSKNLRQNIAIPIVIIGPIAAETMSPMFGRIVVTAEIASVMAVVFIAAEPTEESAATPPDTVTADLIATDLTFFLENFSFKLEIIKNHTRLEL